MNVFDAVTEFGQSLGVGSLALEAGSALLELDSGESIGFVIEDDDLLIHLLTPVPYAGPAVLMRALQASEARALPGFPLQVGARGQGSELSLVAATRLPVAHVLPERLHAACERLIEWSQQTLANG